MQTTQEQIKQRQAVERTIAGMVIDALLRAGFSLGVYDGEEITIRRSKDRDAIFAALFTTDEDYLKVYPEPLHLNSKPPAFGWVRFVYGNDGWDVICDHTVNLESYLAPVDAWIDTNEPS